MFISLETHESQTLCYQSLKLSGQLLIERWILRIGKKIGRHITSKLHYSINEIWKPDRLATETSPW